MLYKLEQRGTSLVMSAQLYNFLLQNHIEYKKDFEKGGLELAETDYNRLILGFKPGFEEKAVKYTGVAENTVKNENMRSNKTAKQIGRRKKLW